MTTKLSKEHLEALSNMPPVAQAGLVFSVPLILLLNGGGLVINILFIGLAPLFLGVYILHKLLTFKHGLLDPRHKIRIDVLGAVATPVQKLGFFARLISLLANRKVGSKFHDYVLKQLGVTSDVDFGREMMARVEAQFKNHENPLLRGDLKTESERRWPFWKDEAGEWQGQFELHLRVPDDMALSVFNHDRLISGDDVSLLTYRLVSRTDLERAYMASLQRTQEMASYVVATCAMLGFGLMLLSFPLFSLVAPGFVAFVCALISSIAVAVAAGILVFTKLVKKALHVRSVAAFANHVVNSDESLRTVTAALLRNKEEVKNPSGGLTAYRNALRMALKDRNPRLQIGVGTGHALLHGVSTTNAYSENQPVCFTNDDLSRGGVAILGATGSGKSFSIILPMMAQIMRAPFDKDEITAALTGGYKMSVSIVTYDPKAALHWDATALANDCGWISRNIGTEENEFGLDFFDGLSAVIVSAILSEAVSQKSGGGGGGSDPFWGSMAAKIRYAAAVIARVYELTDKGFEEVEKTGERIYSPVGVYKLAMACRSSGGYIFKVIETIIKNVRDPQLRPNIAPLCGPELIAAIDFLRRDVLTLFSENTVVGFLANVSDSLADFVSENDIRERFGAARGNILEIDRLWDHKTVTNFRLSKFKYGDVATVITIMAKIRQYHWAAVRLEKSASIAKMSKQIIFIDECQELVTKGGTFSEAQFINMSRAMGLSFVMATQTLSALIEALGSERAVSNMMAQLRSKIFLGTEDPDTLRYLQAVVGTTLQTHIHKDSGYESRLTWRKENLGTINDLIEPIVISDDDLLLKSHPLVHGRVEPLIRGQIDVVNQSYAQSDTEAYEAMYVLGEDWVKTYSPQGRIVAYAASTVKSIIPPQIGSQVPNYPFNMTQIYPDLKMAVGEAVVVVNRATLMRHDKILLSHELGFLQNKNIVIDVAAKEMTTLKTAERVSQLRSANAAKPTVLA